MNNQDTSESGGAPYKPSARKGIHDHNLCINPFCEENMGRYGLKPNKEPKKQPTAYNREGFDEVDNIISKCSREPNFQYHNGRKIERRNSLHSSDDNHTDDSDSNVLSKSLPAHISSYYCSEDYVQQLLNESNRTANTTLSTTNISRNLSHTDSFGSHDSTSVTKTEESIKSVKLYIILPLLSLIVAAICYNKILLTTEESLHTESIFKKQMNNLGEKYNINYDSILELQTGISTIFKRNDTSSFIFTYNSKSNNFNHLQFLNFLEDIVSVAARFLRDSSESFYPTILHSSQLDMSTHSELMNKYRNEIDKTGVMLVMDIDNVPSSLVMAFHYFCDEYNPLVAKSAIFFTLNLANCSKPSEHKSTHIDIESCLRNKWDGVPKDNINPLLARVVNVIVDINSIAK